MVMEQVYLEMNLQRKNQHFERLKIVLYKGNLSIINTYPVRLNVGRIL